MFDKSSNLSASRKVLYHLYEPLEVDGELVSYFWRRGILTFLLELGRQ